MHKAVSDIQGGYLDNCSQFKSQLHYEVANQLHWGEQSWCFTPWLGWNSDLLHRFNTVGVSDAISMGTDGMSFSLQSRDLIADSIETVMGGQWYDANISIPGCDKNMPGTIIAMGRLNRPSLMIYGGTIKPGYSKLTSQPIDIVSAFQSFGEFLRLLYRTNEDLSAL